MNILKQPAKVEMLTRSFMVEKKLTNTRKFDIFHPSAWGSCLRKIAFQFYNEQKQFYQVQPHEVNLKMERIFDNGHKVHARWEDYLDKSGVLRGAWKCENPICGKVYGKDIHLGIFNPARVLKDWKCSCGCKSTHYQEMTVFSDKMFNFYGHVDAIVDVRHTAFAKGDELDIFVVDFKSMRSDFFEELTYAKPEHVVQVHIYMWLLNLQGAVLVYENKDNQLLKEMFVPRNEELITKIKSQAVWMLEVLKANKLPPVPDGFTRSQFPCMLCEFQKLCY